MPDRGRAFRKQPPSRCWQRRTRLSFRTPVKMGGLEESSVVPQSGDLIERLAPGTSRLHPQPVTATEFSPFLCKTGKSGRYVYREATEERAPTSIRGPYMNLRP